jgi:hypothetical protein
VKKLGSLADSLANRAFAQVESPNHFSLVHLAFSFVFPAGEFISQTALFAPSCFLAAQLSFLRYLRFIAAASCFFVCFVVNQFRCLQFGFPKQVFDPRKPVVEPRKDKVERKKYRLFREDYGLFREKPIVEGWKYGLL